MQFKTGVAQVRTSCTIQICMHDLRSIAVERMRNWNIHMHAHMYTEMDGVGPWQEKGGALY